MEELFDAGAVSHAAAVTPQALARRVIACRAAARRRSPGKRDPAQP